jgi:hypothetical protein
MIHYYLIFHLGANMRACKRKPKRGTTPEETYVEAAKDLSVKALIPNKKHLLSSQ